LPNRDARGDPDLILLLATKPGHDLPAFRADHVALPP
jgi:hypothetical protein